MGGKSAAEWVHEYSRSHQHPVNQTCHTIGIPMIALSVVLFAAAIFVPRLWPVAIALFVVGWVLQCVGHYIEDKPPEFFHDWRFLFVGVRWWIAKVRGRG